MNRDACLLCGDTSATDYVLVRLVDDEGQPFAALSRCRARDACRSRVEASGEVWPLVDAQAMVDGRIRHFTEAHRRVFAAAKRWRESRP